MMNLLADKIKRLTENELRRAFNEFLDYNKKGVLEMDTIIRKIRNEFAESINDNYWDMGCIFTSNEIMFEIAKRHYDIKE